MGSIVLKSFRQSGQVSLDSLRIEIADKTYKVLHAFHSSCLIESHNIIWLPSMVLFEIIRKLLECVTIPPECFEEFRTWLVGKYQWYAREYGSICCQA